MHSDIDYIHIELKKGAVASFIKTPTPETLAIVRKLLERAEEKVNKNLVKPDVSGSATDFEAELYKLINKYVDGQFCKYLVIGSAVN